MNLFRKLNEKIKDRYAEKYNDLLLSGTIRLKDVPEWLRMDYKRSQLIHLHAFRADRALSKEWYSEDLSFLEVEIMIAQSLSDALLEASLKRSYDCVNYDF